MKYWKMKLVYGLIILGSLGMIGYTLNYYYGRLGGYDELEVYRLESVSRILTGKRIKSRATDGAFTKLYNRCQNMVAKKEIKGSLTVLNYFYDSLGRNELDQFIGITLEADMAEIPIDFEINEVNTGERLVVFLTMHPLVRPSPEKVEAKILAQAQEDSLELVPFFTEFYFDDNSMIIEGWIKANPIDTFSVKVDTVTAAF